QGGENLTGIITFVWSTLIITIVAFTLKSVFKAPFRQEVETIEIPTQPEAQPITTDSPNSDQTQNTTNTDQLLSQTETSNQTEQPNSTYNAKPIEGWSAQEMAELQQIVAQLKE
ncbi:MAG: hypothetical protein H3C43_13890, partial [Leptonema sp. (in: Bacteria)]|nr:hypothetical protein [Leptonema sp. (in: bacteria)]